MNAFATGRNPSHAAIAVTRGLLEKSTPEEVKGVVAHEMAHIRNWDTLLMTAVTVLGAGRKRGTNLQLLSAFITLLSIVGASYFCVLHAINEYVVEELAKQGQPAPGFIWASPFNADILSAMVSPMTLLIWGIGLYIAFRVPQARKVQKRGHKWAGIG
jgi:hypothetical protein